MVSVLFLTAGLACYTVVPRLGFFLVYDRETRAVRPAPVLDDSNRIVEGRLSILTPFCALGFDLLANKLLCNESYSLEYVSSMEYKVSLGRPLYVLPTHSIHVTKLT